MPAVSDKQYRYMQARAHGNKIGGLGGPTESVAKEFVAKTPASKRSAFSKSLRKKKKKVDHYATA